MHFFLQITVELKKYEPKCWVLQILMLKSNTANVCHRCYLNSTLLLHMIFLDKCLIVLKYQIIHFQPNLGQVFEKNLTLSSVCVCMCMHTGNFFESMCIRVYDVFLLLIVRFWVYSCYKFVISKEFDHFWSIGVLR